MIPGVIDSHCHLDDPRFDEDRPEVIRRAFEEAELAGIVTIGTGNGPPELDVAIRIAEQDERIFASVGVHPHHASKASEETWDQLRQLVDHPKVLLIGEIGLDYHYDFSPRPVQQEVFRRQLEIAVEASKPVTIHTREAWEDTFAILKEYERWLKGGIMHCFSGGPAEAEQALELGMHLSFAGIVTYKNAREVQEAAKLVPASRLLVETDAPYLAPVPRRGRRNEPAFVIYTLEFLAALRGEEPAMLARQTTANFEQLCLAGRALQQPIESP